MEDLLELSRAVNSRSTDKLPGMKKSEVSNGALKALENRINVRVDNLMAKIKESVDRNEKKSQFCIDKNRSKSPRIPINKSATSKRSLVGLNANAKRISGMTGGGQIT
jgi:hypothetical protein